VGGRELDDILLELANAAIEVFEEPKNATNRRTRENGIRIAVGADAMSVLRMVLRQALGVVVSGIGIGLLLALALERGLSAVFGDTGTDVTAYT
jgi:putative ABC transport system permease protein